MTAYCMRSPDPKIKGVAVAQIVRYGLNGIAAAVIHFTVLWFNLKVLNIPSAGLANLVAAAVGITASFFGSRYYVFRSHTENVYHQATKFALLYVAIALLHGLVLYLWSDVGQFDYRIGFLFALVLQVILSYWGNKSLVFKS